MKILFFDISGKGGIAHHIFMMCNALAERGIDVVVVTTRNNELDLKQAKFIFYKIFYPHHGYQSNKRKGIIYLFSLLQLLFLIFKEKPNIVHWHELKIYCIELLFIKFLQYRNIQIVYSAHDVLNQEKNNITVFLHKLYHSFNYIIAHTENNKILIEHLFGINPQKILVIPVGEYTYIAGRKYNKSSARTKLGISRGKKILLFFGYIRKYKGLVTLLDSFAQILKNIPDAFLMIVGEPKEDFGFYKKKIQILGIKDAVFTDTRYIPLNEISVYFSASDIVVLPYLNIYQSGILHLAFAYQRPVIVTNVGGLPEVVEEGKSGFIVPPNNVLELTKAITKSFSNIEKLEMMGRYAFLNAKDKYSWIQIAIKIKNLYNNMMTNHKRI